MKDAAFFDHLFPEAGGWEKLQAIRTARPRETNATVPVGTLMFGSAFSPTAIAHLNKTFRLLEGDVEAQATLAHLISYTQLKHDVAGF